MVWLCCGGAIKKPFTAQFHGKSLHGPVGLPVVGRRQVALCRAERGLSRIGAAPWRALFHNKRVQLAQLATVRACRCDWSQMVKTGRPLSLRPRLPLSPTRQRSARCGLRFCRLLRTPRHRPSYPRYGSEVHAIAIGPPCARATRQTAP